MGLEDGHAATISRCLSQCRLVPGHMPAIYETNGLVVVQCSRQNHEQEWADPVLLMYRGRNGRSDFGTVARSTGSYYLIIFFA